MTTQLSSPKLCEIFEKKPVGFKSEVEVAACYIEIDHRLLLLQTTSEKFGTEVWTVPAGKLNTKETPKEAARRELFEETGISVEFNQIQYLETVYIRKPTMDYDFHIFKIKLDRLPTVHLSEEHQNYMWASEKEIDELPLIVGGKEAYNRYRKATLNRRAGASVNAYLILRKANEVLLLLRKNTGYHDGMWSFPAGHVEGGEPAIVGMIREAKEEIGIQIEASQLKVVHVMHRRSNRLNVDIFFECRSWEGEIQNMEPNKCEDIGFFSLENLPSNMIDYTFDALQAVLRSAFYSEHGWT